MTATRPDRHPDRRLDPMSTGPVPPVLEAHGVTVRAGQATILRDVTVTVRRGEVTALIGPNGAGKSTLVSVLSGDRVPDRGSVRLAGRALADWPRRQLARMRAVMPQSSTVEFGFTARDIVAMGRTPWPAGHDDAIIDDALHRTGAAELADRAFRTLSGGEQARVTLARVLAQRTDVLLLDEPAASLDLRHQRLVTQVISERARAGATVVAVWHDLNHAARADRIVLLARGRVHAAGAPVDVLRDDTLSAAYGCPVRVVENPLDRSLLVLAAEPDGRRPPARRATTGR